jgi:adenylate cyclase
MAIEIERKYLVCNADWCPLVTRRVRLRQAYLAVEGRVSVRVRVVDRSAATLTVKSRKAGLRRAEFEYAIPVADAEQLVLLRQGALIEKVRHIVPWRGLTWEIDTFEGENAGLEIAEVELDHESQSVDLPPWIGAEITGQPRYYNSNLASEPFQLWHTPAEAGVVAES